MTAGLCDFCGHPLTYLNHDACTPEGEAAMETDPGRCADHGLRTPCQGCAADHLAGDHPNRDRADTCARCTTPPAQIDAAALAAADDSLDSPNEGTH